MKTIDDVITITPSTCCSGKLPIPASKSHSQRALACALLSDKKTVIHGIGQAKDEQVLLQLLRQSAAIVKEDAGILTIAAGKKLTFRENTIHFGESGLAVRMCTPLLANSPQELQLTGSGSLTQRPMHVLGEVLPQLQVAYWDSRGKLPLTIKGPLQPTDVTIDGSLSSQFITGILFGIAGSQHVRATTITLQDPKSIPYIDLSIEVLQAFGAEAKRDGNQLTIKTPVRWKETHLQVEGDWSSASFLLVFAAISGSITITNLNPKSRQADRKITEALEAFGANIRWANSELTVSKSAANAFSFDATHCPDLFPPLAVLGCFASGTSRITGLHRLENKESNRALTLQSELGKLGASIRFDNDTMVIEPLRTITPTIVDSCNDHRIAMACALVLLKAGSPGKITRASAINKSFPEFFSYLEKLTSSPDDRSH